MFDTESDRSYISQSLLKRVGGTWIDSRKTRTVLLVGANR